MKILTGILFLLLAQAAQATASPESVIKLQITSLDAHLADTARQSGLIDQLVAGFYRNWPGARASLPKTEIRCEKWS